MWWFIQLTILLQCVHSVRIISIRVPEVLQYGSKDAITLDCDYITNNVTGLVVKWFYMDRSQPVYQWIPPQKPQALGILKNKLDLSYKVSKNPYTQHRALRILSPSTELTGNYTCVVSTFLSEDERTRPMTIFVYTVQCSQIELYGNNCVQYALSLDITEITSCNFAWARHLTVTLKQARDSKSGKQHYLFPETKFDMIQDRLSDGYLNIICSVEGVFPRPELVILAGNRLLNSKSSIKIIEGRFTALTSAVIRIDSLPPTVEILCDMQVPLANYFSRKRDIFFRDPTTNTIEHIRSLSPHSGNDKGPTTEVAPVTLIVCLTLYYCFKIT